MASPKIVPYKPNATLRAPRISTEEWNRLRPRLEKLYVEDDKTLAEVMETMALHDAFHATRRQYTQKFREWGLTKNVPANVMKSALRKRARAGENGISVKFRGTAISEENMDRWQQRVPNFNPMSSPTASTPSEMNVQSPCMALARQAEETLPNMTAQTTPMDMIDRHPMDDDVIDIAFKEVSRSVSPEVAEYVFRRTEERNSTKKNQPPRRWTFDYLWSLPNAGPKLMQLTSDDVAYLNAVSYNLWNFRGRNFQCCMHIDEIILAWTRAFGSREYFLATARNLSIVYLDMGRFDDCKALLETIIQDISSVQSSDPACGEYRSILGVLHSRQGQHDSAEAICTEALISTRSALGLAHFQTWLTYYHLHQVLGEAEKFDAQRRLSKEFYNGIYQEASSQLLPNLRSSLELCETYIDSWMPGSRLQRLSGKRYVRDSPLGIGERHFIVLSTVLGEKLAEDKKVGAVPQIVQDLESVTGQSTNCILVIFARIISLKIEAIRRLKPSFLRQEALRVIRNLKNTKFLVPIFVSTYLVMENSWTKDFDWEAVEHELICLLENTIIENPSGLACVTVQAHHRSLESASATDKSNDVNRLLSINGCESGMGISTVVDRLFTGALETDLSFHNRATMATTLPVHVPAGPRPPSVPIPLPDPASPENMLGFTYPNFFSLSIEPTPFWALPPAQIPQLSDDAQSQTGFLPAVTFHQPPSQVQRSDHRSSHWFSPTLTFSQPLAPAQGHQPPNDAPPKNSFSPTMMSTPASPFTFSPPQTPHLFHMSPPARPAGDSPAAAHSSDLGSLRDYSTTPNIFGTHLSPLRLSSPPAPGS